jgi:hypothetical protein
LRWTIFLILYVIFSIAFFASTLKGYNDTENFWQCPNRVGGSWVFGRAPYACDANVFGADAFPLNDLSPLIFDDTSPRTQETHRYMQALAPTIRDGATYFLNHVKPDASQDELQFWQLTVLAAAHQESYWSHYRLATDSKLKLMRGDYGHGHGLMQVDDRWHFVAVNQGTGWNIVQNILYSLEEIYQGWQRGPHACNFSSRDWVKRARSAYSSYNGGPARVCRWQNPNHRWARNDRGFYEKFQGKGWLRYVENWDEESPIDFACLAEEREVCSDGPPPSELVPNQLYEFGEYHCLYASQRLHCLDSPQHLLCLKAIADFDRESAKPITELEIGEIPVEQLSPQNLCQSLSVGLHPIGSFIRLNKWINLRATPGGGRVGVATKGAVYQVLNVALRSDQAWYRYYKIRRGNQVGYLYGGNLQSFHSWAVKSSNPTSTTQLIVPQVELTLTVSLNPGIRLRAQPGGEILNVVPRGESLSILETQIYGGGLKIFSKVRYLGQEGFIYSGRLEPEVTVPYWVRLERGAP